MNGKEANHLTFIVCHRNHKEVCDVVMKGLGGEALEISKLKGVLAQLGRALVLQTKDDGS